MSTSFNSGPRIPATSSRLQLGGVGGISRGMSSSSSEKPPDPLRRAIADCFSSSLLSAHGSSSAVVSEASRTLREYLASDATTDLAYGVIIEHTLVERKHSRPVVARCVGLLNRYLLRYKPSEESLVEIDRFCANIMMECDRREATSSSKIKSRGLPIASFASGELVKSLNSIRSLVAQSSTSIEKLPEDVLSNIFVRVLARQLAQMRCVSKSWKALLSEPSFVKSHLHHSTININKDNQVLLHFEDFFGFNTHKPTAHLFRSPHLELLPSFIKLPIHPQKRIEACGTIIGSVDGLICFSVLGLHSPTPIFLPLSLQRE